MVVLHFLGTVVYTLLNRIGLIESIEILFGVGFYRQIVQLTYKSLHTSNLFQSIFRESLSVLCHGFGVLENVFGIVSDTLQVPDCPVGRCKIDMVVFAYSLAFGEHNHVVDQRAVEEVELLFRLLELFLLAKFHGGDDAKRPVEIVYRKRGHPENLLLGQFNCKRRGLEHIDIDIVQVRYVLFGTFLRIGNEGRDELDQGVGKRKYEYYRDDVEEGAEHCKLCLRRSRDHSFEKISVSDAVCAEETEQPSCDHKENYT